MAWYNSLAHATGNVVSPILQGVGTVSGRDDLVQAGKAISNPYTTLTSVGNLGHGGASGFTVGQQPVQNTNNAKADAPTAGPGETSVTGGGSVSGGSAYNPQADLDNFNNATQFNQLQGSLGRIGGQQDTAIGNINGDYQSAYERLTDQQLGAQQDYDTNRSNQLQDYQTARDANNANSRNLLMGARRLLGSQGAGGGSADLFAAPLAAQQEGNNANAVVKQTSERNLSALDTGHQKDQDAFGRSFSDLVTQRDRGINDTRSQFAQNQAEIQGQLAGLAGQRALLNGQNYQQAVSASAPFTTRVQSLLDQIDTLAKRPTGVKEQAVNLARPDLAQYSLGRFDAPAVAQQDATLGAAPNAYNTLTGQTDEQRRQLLGA